MLKVERTSVMNMENAIRGARNPMNSWKSSDSYYDAKGNFCLGANDLDLAKRLRTAGPDHRKFLRQIFVSVDITAPLYWWKEYDTYKVATVANSCSTMHKIHAKMFTAEDFSCEHLLADDMAQYHVTDSEGNDQDIALPAIEILGFTIQALNYYREKFLETQDKRYWWQMIQLLPSSYNQMRTCTFNYETLVNIYRARKDHKLDEWHTFCDWIKTLPYARELIILN